MRTFRWLTVSELTLQNVQESSCMSITYFRQTTISESDIIQDFELETSDKHFGYSLHFYERFSN